MFEDCEDCGLCPRHTELSLQTLVCRGFEPKTRKRPHVICSWSGIIAEYWTCPTRAKKNMCSNSSA